MARWIPPIPKAAMYRREAIRLGEALPLLFYCYDYVDRGGWVDLKLSAASDALEVPYPTIKHWWQSIEKAGCFFDQIDRRGRAGLRIHFAPDWIDWSMPTGYHRPDETGSESIPKEAEPSRNGHETGSQSIPFPQNEPENEIVIGTNAGSESIPKNLHVGTHDLQIDSDGDDGDDRRSAPESSPADLVSFLLNEGMGAATEFADIPLEVGRADYLARLAARQSINHIVRAWRRKRPTAEEHYGLRRDQTDHGRDGPGLRDGSADRGAAEPPSRREREYGADRAGGSGAVEGRDAHAGTGPPTGATAAIQASGRTEGAAEPAADYEAALAAARERVARAQARRC